MTNEEFSNEFDVLYNNITSNQTPGLDEYEKSVFLTKAQNELVKAYFSPALNKTQNGFDSNPISQADFSTIISNCTLTKIDNPSVHLKCFDKRATAYELPADLFISLNEQLFSGTIPYTVVPITFMDYNRLMSKPYKYPLKYQAWRMITKNITVDNVEMVSKIYKLEGDDSEYKLTIASNYGKPIHFIVEVGSPVSSIKDMEKPSIEVDKETGVVTITCNIPQGKATSLYWSAFLISQNAFNNYNELMKYVKPFTSEENMSSFPSFTVPNNTSVGTRLYSIYNNGGTPHHQATIAEVVGRFNDTNNIEYNIRYIRKLKPIILINLADIDNELSIEGYQEPMNSELPSELHKDILQRAVELAKAAYVGDLNSQIALGSTSQTNIGVVPQSR